MCYAELATLAFSKQQLNHCWTPRTERIKEKPCIMLYLMIPNSPSANDKVGRLFQLFLNFWNLIHVTFCIPLRRSQKPPLYLNCMLACIHYWWSQICFSGPLSSHIPAPQNLFISPGYYLPVYQMPSGFPFNSHLTSDRLVHLTWASQPVSPTASHSLICPAAHAPLPSPRSLVTSLKFLHCFGATCTFTCTCLSARLFASSTGH